MPALADIAKQFGGECEGGGEVRIRAVASLKNAGEGEIAFYESRAGESALANCRASAVLLARENAHKTEIPKWIVPRAPRAYFARLCQFLAPPPPPPAGISPLASVAEDAILEKAITAGAGSVVESGATIGEGVFLGANVFVGRECVVGKNTRILPGAVLYHNTVVGERCILHSGVVLGADGFGFVADGGEQIKIPHQGRVILGDDVEIGANSCIDRGTLDDTVVGDGVKIDNLVQIGHNVQIGNGTVVCGCVGIAGSAVIGEKCLIGGAADINGHIVIGEGATVGGSSAVVRDVGAGETVSSVWPAIAATKWRRRLAEWQRETESKKRRGRGGK